MARERLLQGGAESIPKLIHQCENSDTNARARALWVLDRIGGEGRDYVVKQLTDADPQWRALAVRILRRHGEAHADKILALAGDADGEVRREVLLAIAKLPGDAADRALAQIAMSYDGSDRYLLETINIAAASRKQKTLDALQSAGKFSARNVQLLQVLDPAAAAALLTSTLAGSKSDDDRISALDQLSLGASVAACREVLTVAADSKATERVRRRAFDLAAANLKGTWQEFKGDPAIVEPLKQLLNDKAWTVAALNVVGETGANSLGDDVLALASNDSAAVDVRAKAMAVAAQLRVKGAAKTLQRNLASKDSALRSAAIGATVDLQDWPALKQLLVDSTVDEATRAEIVDRVMNSVGGALVLLKWLDDKAIGDALRGKVVAKAIKHPDANIRILYEKFVPEDQRPQRLGATIKAEEILALKGNVARGEQIFFQSSAAQCKNCHRVKGQGNTIGPDLTMIGKKYERATLLETILDPSKAIAPEYTPYLVQTTDGLVFAGFVVERNDREVVLRDIQNKQVRLKTKDIDVIEQQHKSLMPELVLRDVTAQDAADLLAYMMTLSQQP